MTDPGPEHSARILAEPVQTLAERLSAVGYDTLGVTANPHLNSAWGLAQGFDEYHDTTSTGFKKKERINAEEVVDLSLNMLSERRDPDRPFYLRMVTIDPHAPLEVTHAEHERFGQPGVPARVARYRAGVNRVDTALSRLDRALTTRGYTPENTLFVLITDHGEGLSWPEHHRGQHGRVLYPSVISVPWLLRGPGVAVGHRVQGLVSHLDFTPTLLSLLGLGGDPSLEGRDWSDRVAGNTHPTDRSVAFSDTSYFGANRAVRVTADQACQQDWGSVGINKDTFEAGCFDRAADPDWTSPTADANAMALLEVWRAKQQGAYDNWPHIQDTDHVVGETQQQLEALGYVE
jgi:arylsulfatase A-like enzyme